MTVYSERSTSVSHVARLAQQGRLFAIVDATDTPSVPVRARELGESRAVSLYRGRAEEDLFAIAPYLMGLEWPTLEWITSSLWSEPWGVFVVADVPLEVLRSHFRRFLVVDGPEGASWYFRFYDPRVLVTYLATCTPEELTEFYGPVIAYGVTDIDTYGVKLFTRDSMSLDEDARPVASRTGAWRIDASQAGTPPDRALRSDALPAEMQRWDTSV